MKRTLIALAASTALVAAPAMAAAVQSRAAAAVETTYIRPATLARGANGTAPHVQGSDLIVGDRHYRFTGRELQYLGTSGDDYVVGTWRQGRPASNKVVRIVPDTDERTVVLTGIEPSVLTLSSDGEQLLFPDYRYKLRETRLKAFSSTDGSLEARHTFSHYISVLDVDGGRAVLASSPPNRTFWWDLQTDKTTRISDRAGYRADIAHDLLAVFTKDPYLGGCSVVSTLSDPGTRLWRSCDQAVLDFSPSGDRLTTVYLLADGLGPGTIELHRTGGRLLARWATGFFDGHAWESDDTLLMRANGNKKGAWVRCTLADCERAGRLTRTRV